MTHSSPSPSPSPSLSPSINKLEDKVEKASIFINHGNGAVMLKQKQLLGRKTLRFQIKSCLIKNKVFEDRSEGVICYEDANGEIVCEGYDEGPRFYHQTPRPSYHPKDVEIFEILQHKWNQIVNGDEEHKNAGKGAIVDSKWINGSTKF